MSTYYRPDQGLDLNELPAPPYLKEYLNYELVVENLAPKTVHSYYMFLREYIMWSAAQEDPFLAADMAIQDVPFEVISKRSNTDIFAYLTYCGGACQNNPSTRAAKLSAIKSFYRYNTQVVKKIEKDPAAAIRPPKPEKHLPKYLSQDECTKLINAVDSQETPSRDRCMLMIFLSCGLRLNEMVSLNKDSVMGEKLVIYGKGRKERVVFLSPACKSAYDDYLLERARYPRKSDRKALFISPRTGKRLTPRCVERMVQKYMLKAGIYRKGLSPHKLRHTAATLMYSSGAGDLLEIQAILGHSSPQTTAIYTHLEQSGLKKVAERFPDIGDAY